MKKRVVVACGTGIATSTVVAEKVKAGLMARGIDVDVTQCKVIELAGYAQNADVIVATTFVNQKFAVPVINAIALITGIGEDAVLDQIAACLKN